jgi:hypothetical protein
MFLAISSRCTEFPRLVYSSAAEWSIRWRHIGSLRRTKSGSIGWILTSQDQSLIFSDYHEQLSASRFQSAAASDAGSRQHS